MGEDGLFGLDHVGCFRVVADELQRVISLDAGTYIEVAVLKQGPTAMRGLPASQINRNLLIQGLIDLIEKMAEQDIFGWDGGVRFEFVTPMTISASIAALTSSITLSRLGST